MIEDVTVVVPAYNEGERIAAVLKTLVRARNSELITDIIVVDDGSIDRTAKVVSEFPVKLVKLPLNQGKGAALAAGITASKTDLILFLDADLVGLKSTHIERLLKPIVGNKKLGMTIGIFRSSGFIANFGNMLLSLSGQRTVRKSWAKDIPDLVHSRYGADTLMTRYAKKQGVKSVRVYLDHLTHVYKEQKHNFIIGFFRYRLKMYLEIAKVLFSGVR
jgi:glycosyltransferase involved in cell wall biosynthesis